MRLSYLLYAGFLVGHLRDHLTLHVQSPLLLLHCLRVVTQLLSHRQEVVPHHVRGGVTDDRLGASCQLYDSRFVTVNDLEYNADIFLFFVHVYS